MHSGIRTTSREQALAISESALKMQERTKRIREQLESHFIALEHAGFTKDNVEHALKRACDSVRSISLHSEESWLAHASQGERDYTLLRMGAALQHLFNQRSKRRFKAEFEKIWQSNWH